MRQASVTWLNLNAKYIIKKYGIFSITLKTQTAKAALILAQRIEL